MTTAPVYTGDYYSDDFIRDPYPHYAEMRSLGPVVYLPKLDNYALTQHAEVQSALRNHAMFSSAKGVAGDKFGCDFLQGNTVASDPPRHTALRRAMAPPLLLGALDSIRPEIERVANEVVEGLVERESFDAIEDFARQLPLKIVTEMVGLPDFGQDNMLKWAAAAFDVLGVQNERGVAALDSIAEMRGFISGQLNRESLKEGSWTYRVLDLVEQGSLDPALAPFAIRDYINPSLDTTISATGQLIWQLAHNPIQWEKLRRNLELCGGAVNEAVRLATPIRNFSRTATSNTVVAGVKIPKGARVMMLLASANRDERVFPNAEQFDLTRDPKDHVGFGSGIHMCIGMHLAQLEMVSLLKAMIPRVGNIVVGSPEVALNNTIAGFSKLPCVFKGDKRKVFNDTPLKSNDKPKLLAAEIVSRELVATDIVALTLSSTNGADLPNAKAGSHIDLHLQDGLVRQYSLTGKLGTSYEIAVQKEANSTGGSVRVHERLLIGTKLSISQPRNHFPLIEGDHHSLLLSGGIGMTPHFAMAWELFNNKKPFTWHLSVRSKDRLAYGAKLQQLPFANSIIVQIDERPEADCDILKQIVGINDRAHVYICGPKGYMTFASGQCSAAGISDDRIHLEHFGAEIDPSGDPFLLVAKRSNLELTVGPNETMLQVLNKAGISVPTSCENGVCGSCLTAVFEGKPDHRDLVMTDAEKAENDRVAVCCSRSSSKRLVLDI